MVLKDLIDVFGKYSYLRLFSHDLAGNAYSSQMYRKEDVPLHLYNAEILKIIPLTFNTIEVSLELVGDPFHKF